MSCNNTYVSLTYITDASCCHAENGQTSPATQWKRGRAISAFSLVEIMVVLVIIGLLAGVVTINVRGHMVRAKQNTARMEIATICNAIDTFYTIHSRYPSNEEGLAILASNVDQNEPLLNQVPVDPWGRSYEYIQPGRSNPYDVMSLGADGREGGEGADRDILSANLNNNQNANAY